MNRNTSTALADMMSALMMTFLFISVAFLAQLEQNSVIFTKELNKALHREFDDNLKRWEAEITHDNIIRFRSPFILGSTTIPNSFKNNLLEFCPRYVTLLESKKFKNGIKEVKVEGHTSKGWNSKTSSQQAFIKNMTLSQERAINVLSFCYLLSDKKIKRNQIWMENTFHANGMASSKPILIEGKISDLLSRRVEFSVIPKISY